MSEENIGGEEGIIEERRKKLQLLRDKNKAYVSIEVIGARRDNPKWRR